jgi:hypothetical protein
VKSATNLRLILAIAVLTLLAACTTAPAGSGAVGSGAINVQDEITATAAGLDNALAAYKAGDAAKADQLAGDAYLDHFEFVEGPLGKVDMAFMQQLEDQISAGVRNAMKDGKPVADVEALVTKAKADLATAATKLK